MRRANSLSTARCFLVWASCTNQCLTPPASQKRTLICSDPFSILARGPRDWRSGLKTGPYICFSTQSTMACVWVSYRVATASHTHTHTGLILVAAQATWCIHSRRTSILHVLWWCTSTFFNVILHTWTTAHSRSNRSVKVNCLDKCTHHHARRFYLSQLFCLTNMANLVSIASRLPQPSLMSNNDAAGNYIYVI